MELADVSQARRRRELVVLEGFHAIKHAIRFGAEILGAWTADPAELEDLKARLAPDIQLAVTCVELEALKQVVPRAQVVAVVEQASALALARFAASLLATPEESVVGSGSDAAKRGLVQSLFPT